MDVARHVANNLLALSFSLCPSNAKPHQLVVLATQQLQSPLASRIRQIAVKTVKCSYNFWLLYVVCAGLFGAYVCCVSVGLCVSVLQATLRESNK